MSTPLPSTVPLVTVVIACYRSQPEHLRAAIGSALAQDWPALEIVVSDDSPDDGLGALVCELVSELGRDAVNGDAAADVPRLSYRHNRPSLGVARNHWACFGAARGELLVILNHDDVLEAGFVRRMAEALTAHPQAVLAFCDHWVLDPDGARRVEASEHNTRHFGRDRLAAGLQTDLATLLLRQSIPLAMGAMFRRSALPAEWPEHAGPAYDLWLSYLLCRSGGVAWYEPERLSAWRGHAGNLSSAAGADWLIGTASCWQAIATDPATAAIAGPARVLAARWGQAGVPRITVRVGSLTRHSPARTFI